MNYRHQADVCHAYQVVVKQHGVPKEQVVTMLYNDVVKSFFNTRRGTMFNEPGGADVYKDVAIDYSGKQITPKNFLAVLRGDEAAMRGVGSGRVVASGPADRGFVYVGHCEVDSDWCVITGAKNIRRWGTTRGLGELAQDGPQKDTILDVVGVVRVPMRAVISVIDCEASKWN